MKIDSWNCVRGDKVKFSMNARSFRDKRLMNGVVVSRDSKSASIRSKELPRLVRIPFSCMLITNPVMTEERIAARLAGTFKVTISNK